MKKYYNRKIESVILNYLKVFPIVGLTGPRQSGKSTTLQYLLVKNYTYVTFDDYRISSLFYDDPEKFMKIYSDKIIFDEVQKVPELFNYLKIAVDSDRGKYGKFVITGSGQFTMMQKITESLAGRIGLISLLPFQYIEMPEDLRQASQYKGSFPEIVKKKYYYWEQWYAAYIETYITKDVRDFMNIGNIHDFRKFLNLLAANTAQILNFSRFAGDLGVSVSTIKRWLSVLETSYIIFLLPPYFKNIRKRIIKSPKVYFYDTGLVSVLTGISNRQMYEQGPMAGSLFENYVIAEIYKNIHHSDLNQQLYYLRTSNRVEVDLIIEKKSSIELIEIKKTSTFKPKMIKTIESLIDKNDKAYLIYQGADLPYLDNIRIINYNDYFLGL